METPKPYPQHVQDRLDARELSRKIVARLQAEGKWDEAARYCEEHIDPINEWLFARGIW
jgi:hypothetical protein